MKTLLKLLHSSDLTTRSFASIAFSHIAACPGKIPDLYPQDAAFNLTKAGSGNTKEGAGAVDAAMKSIKKEADPFPACSVLLGMNGLEEARRLAVDSNPTIRRQGCAAMARFVATETGTDVKGEIMSKMFWRSLQKVLLDTCSSDDAVDLDACRHACWVLNELAHSQENKAVLGGEIFPALLMGIESRDELVRMYSFDSLAALSTQVENRGKLLETSFTSLVRYATKEASGGEVVSHKEQILRDGAIQIILYLASVSSQSSALLILNGGLVSVLGIALTEVLAALRTVGHALVEKEINGKKSTNVEMDTTKTASEEPKKETVDSSKEAAAAAAPDDDDDNGAGQTQSAVTSSGLFEAVSKTSRDFLAQITKVFDSLSQKFDKLVDVFESDHSRWGAILENIEEILCFSWLGVAGASLNHSSLMMKLQQSKLFSVELIAPTKLIASVSSFLQVPSLKMKVAKGLVGISRVWWDLCGEKIFQTLCNGVNDTWIKALIADRSELLDDILKPSCDVFLSNASLGANDWNPFEHSTSIVMDFFSRLCVLNNKPSREMQDVVFAAIQANSCCQFSFRTSSSKDRALELSASSSGSKLWQNLKHFYLYETRMNVRKFLRSSLRLWIALCRGCHSNAIQHYGALLSFDQLLEAIQWMQLTAGKILPEEAKLWKESHLFIDLLNVLYVDTDPEYKEYLHYPARPVTFSTTTGHAQVAALRKHVFTLPSNAKTSKLSLEDRYVALQNLLHEHFGRIVVSAINEGIYAADLIQL